MFKKLHILELEEKTGLYCSNCDLPNEDEALFCENCGHSLADQNMGVYCPKCGTISKEDGAVFCENCGQALAVRPPMTMNNALNMTIDTSRQKKSLNKKALWVSIAASVVVIVVILIVALGNRGLSGKRYVVFDWSGRIKSKVEFLSSDKVKITEKSGDIEQMNYKTNGDTLICTSGDTTLEGIIMDYGIKLNGKAYYDADNKAYLDKLGAEKGLKGLYESIHRWLD